MTSSMTTMSSCQFFKGKFFIDRWTGGIITFYIMFVKGGVQTARPSLLSSFSLVAFTSRFAYVLSYEKQASCRWKARLHETLEIRRIPYSEESP